MRTLLLLSILNIGISSCGVEQSSSTLTANEPKLRDKKLLEFCDYHEPEVDLESLAIDYCEKLSDSSQLADRKLFQDHCPANLMESKILNLLNFKSEQYRKSSGRNVATSAEGCLKDSILFELDLALGRLHQESSSVDPALPTITDQCWTARRMTADGCVMIAPCKDGEAQLPRQLFSNFSDKLAATRQLRSNGEVKICRDDLKEIHGIKDPDNIMLPYNHSFYNLLTHGHKSPHVTYGAANCHGTALHLSGKPYEDFKVEKVTYHALSLEPKCGPMIKERIGNSANSYRGLGIRSEGMIINMDHKNFSGDENDQCGEWSVQVQSCNPETGQITGHFFANKMHLGCWNKILQNQGYTYRRNAERKKLEPGCVLTGSDHSVKVLFRSNNICYFYESAAPYAAPHLKAAICRNLQGRFKHSWCPDKPYLFELGHL